MSELSRQVVDLIQEKYPDWSGFGDPAFNREEIAYKREAVETARDLLAEKTLGDLLGSGQFSEVIERVRKVARSTNLLFLGVPTSGDLAVLHAPDLDEEMLSRAVVDLLYGEGDSPQRLDRFTRLLDDHGLPNRWTLPTYLLFFRFPDRDFFVKPSVTQWFLRLAEADDRYKSQPSGELYASILEQVGNLREELREYGVRDMLDVQSALYVAHAATRAKDGRQPSDPKRHEMDSLFAEFLQDYLGTAEGQEHSDLYEASRAAARKSFREILSARDAGEDVTDRVLLELLPHTDSPRHRESGAWVSVAPAIMGEVRSFFEAAGWQQPDDWTEIAQALLAFIERCVNQPSELAAACAEFSGSRLSTGFQTGMLSPVLNALNPDEFLLVNNKSRRLINYLSGESFSQKLIDYPETNRTGLALIEGLVDLLAAAAGELRLHDIFDAFAHWLVAVRKFSFGKAQYWKISPGGGGQFWERSLEGGFISVGWNELSDLSYLSREEFERRRDQLAKEQEDWTPEAMEQVWKFAKLIREGDRIVANDGTTKVLGFGTVTGPYFFLEDQEHCHRLPVDWDDVSPRGVDEGGWRRTLIKLDRDKFKLLTEAPTLDDDPVPQSPVAQQRNSAYPLEDCAADLRMDLDDLKRWKRALQRKGQVILYGPPGTGKTYVAEHLARHLIGGGDGFTELVQFHPSYAYEDFVQGIRPERMPEGGLDYPVKKGRFLRFCEQARQRQGTCVLIIDEINRANLSRVFGELMYLLEYREREVTLAAGAEPFSIPENVRVLGTMNTADRSIALVDHALRRRFSFLHLGPSYETLRRFHEGFDHDVENLIALLREVNEAIHDPHYQVGITFFLHENLPEHLEDIWRMEILPYLQEYFFSQQDQVDRFGWDVVGKRLSQ